jgi:lauroyl/myristoyl acyltransferase
MNGVSEMESRRIARGVFRGLVKHYEEKMVNGFMSMPKIKRFIQSNICFEEHEQILKEALGAGKGVLIATGHYGGLEFLPVYLAMRGYSTAVAAKFKSDRLMQIMIRRAKEIGLEVIVPGNGTNVLREASRVLGENKIFVIQCDEIDGWHIDRRLTLDFLGRKIHPDRMLNVLCRRTEAVLLFGVMHRENKNGYKLLLHRVEGETGVNASIQTLRLLEGYISRHPEQWYEWRKYHRFGKPIELDQRGHTTSDSVATSDSRPLTLRRFNI